MVWRRVVASIGILSCMTAMMALGGLPVPCAAQATSPFGFFNVFSCETIGSATAPYHSDFQGLSGAAGSAWFLGMSLNDLGLVASEVSFFGGGEFHFTGAVNNGGLEVAGDIALDGVSVDGGVACGADVVGIGGTIDGDVAAAGTITLTCMTVTGATQPGTPFQPTWDLSEVGDFFLARSAEYASWAAVPVTLSSGQVICNAGPGINVFAVTADVLDATWGVAIHGPAGALVILNVSGAAGALTSMDWQVDAGLPLENVLVNFHEATTLEIHGVAVLGNVLAPQAATSFPAGLVVGGLWVGDLQGGGQVNFGFFTPPDPPVPSRELSWGSIKARYLDR